MAFSLLPSTTLAHVMSFLAPMTPERQVQAVNHECMRAWGRPENRHPNVHFATFDNLPDQKTLTRVLRDATSIIFCGPVIHTFSNYTPTGTKSATKGRVEVCQLIQRCLPRNQPAIVRLFMTGVVKDTLLGELMGDPIARLFYPKDAKDHSCRLDLPFRPGMSILPRVHTIRLGNDINDLTNLGQLLHAAESQRDASDMLSLHIDNQSDKTLDTEKDLTNLGELLLDNGAIGFAVVNRRVGNNVVVRSRKSGYNVMPQPTYRDYTIIRRSRGYDAHFNVPQGPREIKRNAAFRKTNFFPLKRTSLMIHTKLGEGAVVRSGILPIIRSLFATANVTCSRGTPPSIQLRRSLKRRRADVLSGKRSVRECYPSVTTPGSEEVVEFKQ